MGQGYRPRGQRVAPLALDKIRKAAELARTVFNVSGCWVDVVRLLDHRLFELGVVFKVGDPVEMGLDEARARPDQNEITVRMDVYEALYWGDKRARFTVSHEIGHLVLHKGATFAYARIPGTHRPFEDSEWQADSFAGEFLAPVQLVQAHCMSVTDIASTFGLSMDAAIIRHNILRRERLITW